MQVHVENSWRGRTVDVWVYRDPGYQLHFEGGTATWAKVDEGAETPASLRFPLDVFEALMREAEGVVPAGTGTTEALIDAKKVRDRLLTLVETLAVKP